VLTASIIKAIIALMIKAATTSETLVNFYWDTRRNIPEDSHLHIRRRENLKYHHVIYIIRGRQFAGSNLSATKNFWNDTKNNFIRCKI
jgi:hypothetical protein